MFHQPPLVYVPAHTGVSPVRLGRKDLGIELRTFFPWVYDLDCVETTKERQENDYDAKVGSCNEVKLLNSGIIMGHLFCYQKYKNITHKYPKVEPSKHKIKFLLDVSSCFCFVSPSIEFTQANWWIFYGHKTIKAGGDEKQVECYANELKLGWKVKKIKMSRNRGECFTLSVSTGISLCFLSSSVSYNNEEFSVETHSLSNDQTDFGEELPNVQTKTLTSSVKGSSSSRPRSTGEKRKIEIILRLLSAEDFLFCPFFSRFLDRFAGQTEAEETLGLEIILPLQRTALLFLTVMCF